MSEVAIGVARATTSLIQVWQLHLQKRQLNDPIPFPELKAFLEALKGNTSLQEKLEAAKITTDEIVVIAKEFGYEFTADTLRLSRIPKNNKGRFHLSNMPDEELSHIRGGYSDGNDWTPKTTWMAGERCNNRYYSY